MRARATSRGTYAANALTGSHLGAHLDAANRKVHVPAFGIIPVANGNLVSAELVKSRNGDDTFGDGVNGSARRATVVDTVMCLALARNRMDAATERTCNMQAIERVTQAIENERFAPFGVVGVKGALRIRILVAESLMVTDDASVEFRIDNLARNPDGVLVEGFFEKDTELVSGASQGESHLALEHATYNTYHATRNAHLEKCSVQGATFGKRPFENGLAARHRLFNQLVDVARIGTGEHVDRRRIRGITELLDTSRRIEGGIEHLSHAKL